MWCDEVDGHCPVGGNSLYMFGTVNLPSLRDGVCLDLVAHDWLAEDTVCVLLAAQCLHFLWEKCGHLPGGTESASGILFTLYESFVGSDFVDVSCVAVDVVDRCSISSAFYCCGLTEGFSLLGTPILGTPLSPSVGELFCGRCTVPTENPVDRPFIGVGLLEGGRMPLLCCESVVTDGKTHALVRSIPCVHVP